jgi:hypothetical protein
MRDARKALTCALAVLFAVPTTNAMAAPPIINGDFIVETSIICQYEIGTTTANTPDGIRVTGVFGTFKGQFEKIIMKVRFNNATKRASGSGTVIRGDHVAVSGQAFQGVIEGPTSFNNQPFSNTATTLRIGSDTYKVFYGNVDGGRLKHAVFLRRDGRCAESGTVMQVEN